MTYLLDTGLPTKTEQWFSNFMLTCSSNANKDKVKLADKFESMLQEHNGHGTKSAFIKFDTKEDALAFVLRFS